MSREAPRGRVVSKGKIVRGGFRKGRKGRAELERGGLRKGRKGRAELLIVYVSKMYLIVRKETEFCFMGQAKKAKDTPTRSRTT